MVECEGKGRRIWEARVEYEDSPYVGDPTTNPPEVIRTTLSPRPDAALPAACHGAQVLDRAVERAEVKQRAGDEVEGHVRLQIRRRCQRSVLQLRRHRQELAVTS